MIPPKSVLGSARSLVLSAMLLFPATDYAQLNDAPVHRDGFFHRLGDSLSANLHARVEPKPLKWKAIVIPAGLITYGTLSVTSGWLNDVNLLGKRWASPNEDPNRKTRIDDFTQYVPAIACYGLRIGGVRGKHNFVDATLMYALSNGLANAVVTPLKRLSAEKRPDSSDNL